jgi:2-polyprenyl-6-methoxyphenol hydroxylase-like FAD-dependent oxidoreductase
MGASDDSVHVFRPAAFGQRVLVFPLGGQRFRVYFVTGRRDLHHRLVGREHVGDFIALCVASGVPHEWWREVRLEGPLATFEDASFWVDHPHRFGVVLLGDATACSDPSWGCGLALTLRDVRVLRDELLAT